MSDRSSLLQSFVQEIQNKVSIAVALAVIKSKPDNVTAEEYARDLQNRVLKEWQKNPVPDIFEDKIVSMRLNKAAQDVAEVLPSSPVVESDESPVDLDSSNVLENLPSYRSPSPIPNESVIEEHGIYFQSLVRLKFAVETRKTVPFDSVRDFIEGAKSHTGSVKSNIQGFGSPRKSTISQDSGVVSSAANGSKVPNSVSSSLFRSITHSAETEALIAKSSQSLLSYVRSAVFSTPFDSYYRWKGSLLEKTCHILTCSSVDSQCRSAVVSFIASSLDQIWMIDDGIKSYAVEHQLMILSTLCGLVDVCSSALNNVMSKFDEFTERFSSNELPSPTDVHKVEKIPHFLRFAEILFASWRRRVTKRLKNSEEANTSSSSLTKLWRLKSDVLAGSSLDKNEIVLLKSWRETLEKLSISCVEVYPLINSHLLKTLAAIDSLVGTMEPNEESNVFFDTICDDTP
ncbi:hypothetical protein GE061_011430 [Apolygus lucorum]|uniref:Uncharacterized protein n=1 Tax=Apolygus lucorum TaxID=248454 RepID=A0A8S9XZJ1_APOLU|nr:hypothetical protein GE061_011430 [Apolygus lucorum]